MTPEVTPEVTPEITPGDRGPVGPLSRRQLQDYVESLTYFTDPESGRGEETTLEGCARWTRAQDRRADPEGPYSRGATAAMRCGDPDGPDGRVNQYAVFAFPDLASLEPVWEDRISSITSDEDRTSKRCDFGSGTYLWPRGEIICYVTENAAGNPRARIRWMDEVALTYGILDADDRWPAPLAEFWADLHQQEPPS